MPVPKKNGKEIRWAVDYRRLNAVTKKDAFPLPNIADNLTCLCSSRIFLALDGAGAFHAVPIRQADREKTTFYSPFGQYLFIKMPFGLANAPAMYSRLVAKALRHLHSSEVLCYLDDTAIHSAYAWGHLRILQKVLTAFRAAGLQISPEKAQLFQDRIKYLGHEVSAKGISIPPEYTSVINKLRGRDLEVYKIVESYLTTIVTYRVVLVSMKHCFGVSHLAISDDAIVYSLEHLPTATYL